MRKFIFIFLLICSSIYARNITNEDTTSWYKTQIGEGLEQSGPTCIAMIVERSGPATSTDQIKSQLSGIDISGTHGFDELLKILNIYEIHYEWLNSLDKWNGDGVLMILLDLRYIPEIPYDYNGGQYIILTDIKDDNYVVNDPMVGLPGRYYSQDGVKNARYRYIIWIP